MTIYYRAAPHPRQQSIGYSDAADVTNDGERPRPAVCSPPLLGGRIVDDLGAKSPRRNFPTAEDAKSRRFRRREAIISVRSPELKTRPPEFSLWDVASRKELANFRGYSDGLNVEITGLAFSPDGGTLAAGDYRAMVKLWDVASRKEVKCYLPDVRERFGSLGSRPERALELTQGVVAENPADKSLRVGLAGMLPGCFTPWMMGSLRQECFYRPNSTSGAHTKYATRC
jgi:hypothetical protein